MLLLGQEKATGGKVCEGHGGESGAEDGAGQAMRGRQHERSGRRGPRPQRATWGQRGPTHTGHRGRDRWGHAAGARDHSSKRATEAYRRNNGHPPHPSPPHPSLANIPRSCDRPPSKIISPKTKPENALSALCKAKSSSVYTTGVYV